MIKNKFKHRIARREAGLTSCVNCKDTGSVMRREGSGAGRFGFRMWTEVCKDCRCLLCENFLDKEGGFCKKCEEKIKERYEESKQKTPLGHKMGGLFRNNDTARSDT